MDLTNKSLTIKDYTAGPAFSELNLNESKVHLEPVSFPGGDEIGAIVGAIVSDKSYENGRYVCSPSKARIWFEKDPTGETIPEDVLPKDLAREFAKRLKDADDLHGKKTRLLGFDLPKDVIAKVISLLPQELQDQNPEVCIQEISNGDHVTPHRDHTRRSTLFYIFTEPDMDTRWWSIAEPFEEYSFFRYPDVYKIKETFRGVIQKNQWYVFDNAGIHSAHRLPNKTPAEVNRIQLLIQFHNLGPDELLEIVNRAS